MRRAGICLLALFVACVQLALHGLGQNVVVPSMAIITIVLLLNRWSFSDLAVYAVSMGVILESASLAPVGTHIIACLLIVLVGKVVLRQAADSDTSRGGFSVVLGICVTLAYNLAVTFSMSSSALAFGAQSLALRIAVETVYNVIGIAFGYYVILSGRESTASYRLPNR